MWTLGKHTSQFLQPSCHDRKLIRFKWCKCNCKEVSFRQALLLWIVYILYGLSEYLFISDTHAYLLSLLFFSSPGLNWADLYPCVKWMHPFAKSILEVGQSPIKFFPHINPEDCHNIQTHNCDMTLLVRQFSDFVFTHDYLMP